MIPNYFEVGALGWKFDVSNLAGPTSIGNVISKALPYVFVIAGLLLFAYLLYGGFQLVTSFGSPKGIYEAWLIIFRALVGFALVFASFWLIRLIEGMFGLRIL